MPHSDIAGRSRTQVPRLLLVVLLSGTGSLATEICASRLVAPFFGDAIGVWAIIIGVILAALSIGYWYGGKLADLHPDPRLLGALIAAAAALVAALPFAAHPILVATIRAVGTVPDPGSVLIGVLALFAIPTALLGMVAPFAIRLAVDDVASAGMTAGRMYAASTVGSIIGSFGSALVGVPTVGTQRTLIAAAAVLAVAATLLVRWAMAVALILAAALAIPPAAVRPGGRVLFETETAYQYVQVVEAGDGSRSLVINEGIGIQSVWYPHSVLTGGEWDTFLVVPPLVGHPSHRVLIIGNGGGTISRAYGRFYPDAAIDGVELDPVVSRIGVEYFSADANPRLVTINQDGRRFLTSTGQRYDIVIVDAYHQLTIPPHLATAEFFGEIRDHLVPGGILAVNVVDPSRDHRIGNAVENTVASVFPQTWTWPAVRSNESILAFTAPIKAATMADRLRALDPALASLTPLFEREIRPVQASGPPLTDDLSPVDVPSYLPPGTPSTPGPAFLPTVPSRQF